MHPESIYQRLGELAVYGTGEDEAPAPPQLAQGLGKAVSLR